MTPEDILTAYETALNHRDFDRVTPLISESAVFWFTDGTFVGHTAIRAACEKTWARIDEETYWLTGKRWIARNDDAAACTYDFNWTGVVEGVARSGFGRGTTVLAREADGWKIVHEHLSQHPA